jgi:hypothetical protein
LVTAYRRLPPSLVPLLLIILGVALGNFIYLSRLEVDNPITWTAGISHFLCHVTCGRPAIDPNVGYITQALGHRSAVDLLHGHLPWWNYYEGLGQPLVGEMQSAAFFPLTLLFAFSSGLLWFHICLEIIAGISTYFLARRLSIPILFATAAGILFSLNGTFAWLGNAVLNPVCFLPMLLLGIEMILDSTKTKTNKGWYVAAIAIALSLYAGFPEVAYLDGIFCIAWAIARIFSLPKNVRLMAARRVGLAGVVGGIISLPGLIPFYDFYKVANVGSHNSAGQAIESLPVHALPMFFDPYVYGTIFSNPNVGTIWGGIGGYFTISVSALALLGLFGSVHRPLRIFLGAWTLFGVLGAYNIFKIRLLWNVIPLLKNAGFARYIMPSCEIALILLAVLGIMDFASNKKAQKLFTFTTLAALLVLIWSALDARSWNRGVPLSHDAHIIFIGLDLLPFLAVFFLLVAGRLSKYKFAPFLVALIVVGESLLMFFVPTAESPKQITIDQAPISYLQTHEGQYRFLDFAVLYPNWGSQYGLNELSAVDLPFPESFTKLLESQLYPGLTPGNQFTIHHGLTGIELLEREVLKHFKAFEGTSVKYLLMPSSVVILPQLTKLGVKQVFKDSLAEIFEMPNPRPFFSVKSATCEVGSDGTSDVNVAKVVCTGGGTTLIRTELEMAGWKAFVNGKPVPITVSDGVYQAVSVPSGTSIVTYSFLPPHEKYAVIAGLLALFFLIGVWIRDRRKTRIWNEENRPTSHPWLFGEDEDASTDLLFDVEPPDIETIEITP